jgi:hypothetical protein
MRPHQLPGLCVCGLIWAAGAGWFAPPGALAQNDPHLGYIYPAGGQVGTEISTTVGGQYLNDATEIMITGQGIQATIGKHKKPLTQGEAGQLREKIDQVREKLEAEGKKFDLRNRRGAFPEFLKLIKEMGVTEEDLERFNSGATMRSGN